MTIETKQDSLKSWLIFKRSPLGIVAKKRLSSETEVSSLVSTAAALSSLSVWSTVWSSGFLFLFISSETLLSLTQSSEIFDVWTSSDSSLCTAEWLDRSWCIKLSLLSLWSLVSKWTSSSSIMFLRWSLSVCWTFKSSCNDLQQNKHRHNNSIKQNLKYTLISVWKINSHIHHTR